MVPWSRLRGDMTHQKLRLQHLRCGTAQVNPRAGCEIPLTAGAVLEGIQPENT